jgi:RNAse (barnase) inhibitor barstar
MMPPARETILADRRRSGAYVYFGDPEVLRAAAAAAGLKIATVDLTGVAGKEALLERLAGSLNFPAHFGANWDALYDSLAELATAQQNGLVIEVQNSADFAARNRRELGAALKVFSEAVNDWRGAGKPLWFVFELADHKSRPRQLPVLNLSDR